MGDVFGGADIGGPGQSESTSSSSTTTTTTTNTQAPSITDASAQEDGISSKISTAVSGSTIEGPLTINSVDPGAVQLAQNTLLHSLDFLSASDSQRIAAAQYTEARAMDLAEIAAVGQAGKESDTIFRIALVAGAVLISIFLVPVFLTRKRG
jgi:hypothetical protein